MWSATEERFLVCSNGTSFIVQLLPSQSASVGHCGCVAGANATGRNLEPLNSGAHAKDLEDLSYRFLQGRQVILVIGAISLQRLHSHCFPKYLWRVLLPLHSAMDSHEYCVKYDGHS